jgi:hypothetical protein
MFRCFSSAWGIIAVIGATLIAADLVFWHGLHLAALLPIILLLACPLSRLLTHGHSHNNAHADRQRSKLQKVLKG